MIARWGRSQREGAPDHAIGTDDPFVIDLAALAEAESVGSGVALLTDGSMVDAAMRPAARRTVALAERHAP